MNILKEIEDILERSHRFGNKTVDLARDDIANLLANRLENLKEHKTEMSEMVSWEHIQSLINELRGTTNES